MSSSSATQPDRPLPAPCALCGAMRWQALPSPHDRQSIATSGMVFPEPLAKAHCGGCGAVQRVYAELLAQRRFYENDYAGYYERIGSEHFDAARYQALVKWIAKSVAPFQPASIADVGCGQGGQMIAMAALFPEARIEGFEPSIANSQEARRKGLTVHTMRIGERGPSSGTFDLVFNNEVIQHSASPPDFLKELASLAGDSGRLVTVCPDSSTPNNEMLWIDQGFSFSPHNLFALAREAGLFVVHWERSSGAILNKQIIVMRKRLEGEPAIAGPGYELDLVRLYDARCRYLESWRKLDPYLLERIAGRRRVFNFGASMWSYLLAGYCPGYWERVSACLVDGFSGRFVGKPVLARETLQLGAGDVVVLGVSPSSQVGFAQTLPAAVEVVRWDQLLPA